MAGVIKIYEPNEKNFYNNGLGTIQPLSCEETKKASLGGWYLDITVDTKYESIIQRDNIVYALTKEKREQAFRIGNPKKTDRKISFTATHVIFDAANYLLDDVRPTELGPVNFLKWCNERTDQASPFSITGDATGIGTNYFIRKSLLEAMTQMEETFDCIIDADNFLIRVMKKESVGKDNGFSVAYGKNIQGVSITENWDDVCTKIMPVGSNELLLPEKYLTADVQYQIPYTKVGTFDIPDKDDNDIDYTEDQKLQMLRSLATDYLNEHKYPQVSYNVKSDVPQELSINDVVYIKHPLVNLSANVQEYKYDCISKRVKSLTFGNYDDSLKSIYHEKTKNEAVSIATSITGNSEKRTNKRIEEDITKVNKSIESVKKSTEDISDTIGELDDLIGDSLTDGILNEAEVTAIKSTYTNIVNEYLEVDAEYQKIKGNNNLPNQQYNDIVNAFEDMKTKYNSVSDAYVELLNASTPTELSAVKVKMNKANAAFITSMKEYRKVAVDALNAIADTISSTHITQYDLQMQNLTSIMTNGLGLFKTEIIAENGSTLFYLHNKPNLSDSKIQWTMRDNAFAVSTDYGQTWNAGFDSSGNAILNILSAVGINADWVKVGLLTAIAMNNGKGTFTVDKNGNVVANSLKSSNANITGGKVNIVADSDTEDRISLSHGNYSTSMAPGAFDCNNRGTYHTNMSAAGFFAYDDQDTSQYSWVNIGGIVTRGQVLCQSISILGEKKRIASTENYDKRSLYCDEMPSPVFTDMGDGETDGTGTCEIFIDDIFIETIDTECAYQVFLQPYGEGDIYVSERSGSYFVVKGTENLKFGWVLKAIQKGFDTLRLEKYNDMELKESRTNYVSDILDYAQDDNLEDLLTDFENESEENQK